MESSHAKFVNQCKGLKWLEPMFNELKNVIDQYISWEEESPYWNNESASVSMLVAAGASARYIVLSDFRTDKLKESEPIDGRCDLFVGKEDDWLEIEAKPTYVRLENADDEIKK